MRRMLVVLLLFLAPVCLTGCAPFWQALTVASQGARYLSSALDVAAGGADAWFARHPARESEQEVKAALLRARATQAALDAALAAAASAERGTAAEQRAAALLAYGELRNLLDALGILEGRAPAGGAETGAPMPHPVYLPTVEQLSRHL